MDRSAAQASATKPRPRAYVRHPGDVLRVVLGALLLLATMTAIHQDRIGVRETNVFRLINDLALPGWTKWPVWGVMQLGVIGAVPLVALLALATRRLRLAAYAALAGGTIYLVAKLVKEFVQRSTRILPDADQACSTGCQLSSANTESPHRCTLGRKLSP